MKVVLIFDHMTEREVRILKEDLQGWPYNILQEANPQVEEELHNAPITGSLLDFVASRTEFSPADLMVKVSQLGITDTNSVFASSEVPEQIKAIVREFISQQ